MDAPITLMVSDDAVRSSLGFSLGIEGFAIADPSAADEDDVPTAALVIDRGPLAAGLAALAALRRRGCRTPAIVLATNPTRRMLNEAAAAGAVVIEKPLLGDELSRALRAALQTEEAA